MRNTAQMSLVLIQVLCTSSHYWPRGYTRASRGHTWSSLSLSRVSRHNNYLSSPPQQYSYPSSQQLYSAPQHQPQQLYSSPSQLYTSPSQLYSSQPIIRDFSQPRTSVKQRNWPIKGINKRPMFKFAPKSFNFAAKFQPLFLSISLLNVWF